MLHFHHFTSSAIMKKLERGFGQEMWKESDRHSPLVAVKKQSPNDCPCKQMRVWLVWVLPKWLIKKVALPKSGILRLYKFLRFSIPLQTLFIFVFYLYVHGTGVVIKNLAPQEQPIRPSVTHCLIKAMPYVAQHSFVDQKNALRRGLIKSINLFWRTLLLVPPENNSFECVSTNLSKKCININYWTIQIGIQLSYVRVSSVTRQLGRVQIHFEVNAKEETVELSSPVHSPTPSSDSLLLMNRGESSRRLEPIESWRESKNVSITALEVYHHHVWNSFIWG